MRILQHIQHFKEKDGIGNDIIGLEKLFESHGLESLIVCEESFSQQVNRISLDTLGKTYKEDIHILHYGGYSYPVKQFMSLNGKKGIRFHNLTPAYFFNGYTDQGTFETLALHEKKAFIELSSLNKKFNFWLFDSGYNQWTYQQITGSFQKGLILPIVRKYPVIKKVQETPNYKIGFVGRMVPNKKIEDIIILLQYLVKINSKYTLTLIGKKVAVFQQYFSYLEKLIAECSLENHVVFLEDIEDISLHEALSSLDFFVCMSEHEGFCIPILEAFASQIPVVAYNATAIPETTQNKGILIRKKDFIYIAELIDFINHNFSIKKKIVDEQLEVLGFYNSYTFDVLIDKIVKA